MRNPPLQESETVEWKRSLAELKQGLESMAAILNNHRMGTPWFGVRNEGDIDSFNGPSFLVLLEEETGQKEPTASQKTSQKESEAPKKTGKKPQRSGPCRPHGTTFGKHQGTGCSMPDEYSQCAASRQ
jgi:hypothetical protein